MVAFFVSMSSRGVSFTGYTYETGFSKIGDEDEKEKQDKKEYEPIA